MIPSVLPGPGCPYTRRMAGGRFESAAPPPSVRKRGEERPRAKPSVFLTLTEALTVANADPIALRALLSPDFDGVAASFARLLEGVVRRCKWDEQVKVSRYHADTVVVGIVGPNVWCLGCA